mmetsp:Transcript_17883/g.55347  ORF Transcript_17883/g.55347 Transcript_17883/m.55347 type:complete len:204 (-) Transcript_17883:3-614(-)
MRRRRRSSRRSSRGRWRPCPRTRTCSTSATPRRPSGAATSLRTSWSPSTSGPRSGTSSGPPARACSFPSCRSTSRWTTGWRSSAPRTTSRPTACARRSCTRRRPGTSTPTWRTPTSTTGGRTPTSAILTSSIGGPRRPRGRARNFRTATRCFGISTRRTQKALPRSDETGGAPTANCLHKASVAGTAAGLQCLHCPSLRIPLY